MPDESQPSFFVNALNRSARGLQDTYINFLQNLPETIKTPIRHGIGRVLTNTMSPSGNYELNSLASAFTPRRLSSTVGAIIKDQPTREANKPQTRPLFREYFDLPTQDTANAYTHEGKQYRLNPSSQDEEVQADLKNFKEHAFGEYGQNLITGSYFAGSPDPWNFDIHSNLMPPKNKPLPMTMFAQGAVEAIGHPAILQTNYWDNPAPKEKLFFPNVIK